MSDTDDGGAKTEKTKRWQSSVRRKPIQSGLCGIDKLTLYSLSMGTGSEEVKPVWTSASSCVAEYILRFGRSLLPTNKTEYLAAFTTYSYVVGGERDSEYPRDCFSAAHSAMHESEENETENSTEQNFVFPLPSNHN
jgi:hypothetical protein